MKIRFLTSIVTLLLLGELYAQQPEDILRYGTLGFGYTARSAGLAGAIGSVGNDPASISYNPAGVAVNRHHVFNVSLSNNNVGTSTSYIGQIDNNALHKYNMPSIGIILSGINYEKKKPVTNGWCNYNFGMNISRLSDFAQNFFYEGTSSKSSIADGFANDANRARLDKNIIIADGGSPENLALQTGIIDNFPVYDSVQKNFYNNYIPIYLTKSYAPGKGPVFSQNGSGNYSGRFSEVDFAFGANYSNKLFIGGTLAIGIIRYNYSLTHEEVDSGNRIPDFKSLSYNQWNHTKGASVGLKLGVIYRVTDEFRLGLAVHTPQVFNLKDTYGYQLTVTGDAAFPKTVLTEDPGYYSNYKYTLPARYILSMSYVKDKSGLISADLEIPNYKNASFNDSSNALKDRNKYILNNYSRGIIFRLGGELYRDKFFFRAGTALYSSPFVDKTTYTLANQSRQYVTAGIGYHSKTFSIDLGYIYSQSKNFYTPYVTGDAGNYASAVNSSKTNQIVITYLYRF